MGKTGKICLAVMCTAFVGATSFAQGIGDLRLEPKAVSSNQPIKLIIESRGDATPCGLEVNLGDGTVRRVRGDSFPVTVEHTYKSDGEYAISVTGNLMVRGLKTLGPCDGNKSIVARVGGAGVTATDQSRPTTGANHSALQQAPSSNVTADVSKAAEELKQNELKKLEQERIAAEQKRKEEELRLADEKRKREAEQAAQKAEQDRQFKQLNELGVKFAKESTTKWRALQTKDQMTGKVTEYAKAEVSSPAGNAAVELRCLKVDQALGGPDRISVTFIINNLLVPTTITRNMELATGRVSINGRVGEVAHVFEKGSVNRFDTAIVSTFGDEVLCRYNNSEIIGYCKGYFKESKLVEHIHSLMLSIKTFKGEILVQVPPFDSAIRSIVKDCAGK